MGFWTLFGAISFGMFTAMAAIDGARIGLTHWLARHERQKAKEAQKRLAESLNLKEEQISDYMRVMSMFSGNQGSTSSPFMPIEIIPTSTADMSPTSGTDGENEKESDDGHGQYL